MHDNNTIIKRSAITDVVEGVEDPASRYTSQKARAAGTVYLKCAANRHYVMTCIWHEVGTVVALITVSSVSLLVNLVRFTFLQCMILVVFTYLTLSW